MHTFTILYIIVWQSFKYQFLVHQDKHGQLLRRRSFEARIGRAKKATMELDTIWKDRGIRKEIGESAHKYVTTNYFTPTKST